MDNEFINLTLENIDNEHLCCIIRSKKGHTGIEKKKKWLSERLNEGHIFRKLNKKVTVFIEYAPLETAWVPVIGENYMYIYCLWVSGEFKGKGYGKKLLEYAINDAKIKNKSGICMLGSEKQKAWLSDQSFVKKYEFKIVDSTDNKYELLALTFDGTIPKFSTTAKEEKIASRGLTIYYDMQCPYIFQNIEIVKNYCDDNNIALTLIEVDSLEKAKQLPCAFNNFAVFYNGVFQTVNILSIDSLKRILRK